MHVRHLFLPPSPSRYIDFSFFIEVQTVSGTVHTSSAIVRLQCVIVQIGIARVSIGAIQAHITLYVSIAARTEQSRAAPEITNKKLPI